MFAFSEAILLHYYFRLEMSAAIKMMPPPKIAVMRILKKQLTKLSYENIRDKCINDKSSCAPHCGLLNGDLKIRPPSTNSNQGHSSGPKWRRQNDSSRRYAA
jgi:hypothetical protein